jgi:hypothetical protein
MAANKGAAADGPPHFDHDDFKGSGGGSQQSRLFGDKKPSAP